MLIILIFYAIWDYIMQYVTETPVIIEDISKEISEQVNKKD